MKITTEKGDIEVKDKINWQERLDINASNPYRTKAEGEVTQAESVAWTVESCKKIIASAPFDLKDLTQNLTSDEGRQLETQLFVLLGIKKDDAVDPKAPR